MEEPSAVGAVPAEEGGMALSGHTYLPGTASLVQEIDSKVLKVSDDPVPFYILLSQNCREIAGGSQRWPYDDRLPQKCRSVW